MLLIHLVLAVAVSLSPACVSSTGTANNAGRTLTDTVIVAKQQQQLNINKSNTLATVNIIAKKPVPGSRYFLQIDGATLQEQPEGAYELHLSKEKPTKINTSPTNSSFVDVLDTYTINSSPTKPLLFDVSDHLKKLVGNDQQALFVTILFRGNTDANKKESFNAGNLTIKALTLLEVQ